MAGIEARQRHLAALAAKGSAPPVGSQFWAKDLGSGKLALANPNAGIDGVDRGAACARFIISTPAQDRDGDVMVPKGCLAHLHEYEANPVVFFDHRVNFSPLPIAQALDPAGNFGVTVEEDRVLSWAKFHQLTRESAETCLLVMEGVIRGASVTFLPVQAERNRASKATRSEATGGYIYHAWRLLEWSVCALQCNQEALAMNFAKLKSVTVKSALEPYLPKRKATLLVSKGSDWSEDKHPRAEDGKFGSGGSGGGKESSSDKPSESTPGSSGSESAHAANDDDAVGGKIPLSTAHSLRQGAMELADALDQYDIEPKEALAKLDKMEQDFIDNLQAELDTKNDAMITDIQDLFEAVYTDHPDAESAWDNFSSAFEIYYDLAQDAANLRGEIEDAAGFEGEYDAIIGGVEAFADSVRERHAAIDEAYRELKSTLHGIDQEFHDAAHEAFDTLNDEDFDGSVDDLNDELEQAGNPYRIIYSNGSYSVDVPEPTEQGKAMSDSSKATVVIEAKDAKRLDRFLKRKHFGVVLSKADAMNTQEDAAGGFMVPEGEQAIPFGARCLADYRACLSACQAMLSAAMPQMEPNTDVLAYATAEQAALASKLEEINAMAAKVYPDLDLSGTEAGPVDSADDELEIDDDLEVDLGPDEEAKAEPEGDEPPEELEMDEDEQDKAAAEYTDPGAAKVDGEESEDEEDEEKKRKVSGTVKRFTRPVVTKRAKTKRLRVKRGHLETISKVADDIDEIEGDESLNYKGMHRNHLKSCSTRLRDVVKDATGEVVDDMDDDDPELAKALASFQEELTATRKGSEATRKEIYRLTGKKAV